MTSASRSSYSPDSRVRTSSASMSAASAGRSAAASSISASSSRSTAACASSSRGRSASTRLRSLRRCDIRLVTRCARSWSFHSSGSAASLSSSASSLAHRRRGRAPSRPRSSVAREGSKLLPEITRRHDARLARASATTRCDSGDCACEVASHLNPAVVVSGHQHREDVTERQGHPPGQMSATVPAATSVSGRSSITNVVAGCPTGRPRPLQRAGRPPRRSAGAARQNRRRCPEIAFLSTAWAAERAAASAADESARWARKTFEASTPTTIKTAAIATKPMMSSVELSRHPGGLASASRVRRDRARAGEAVDLLSVVTADGNAGQAAVATHPPRDERQGGQGCAGSR